MTTTFWNDVKAALNSGAAIIADKSEEYLNFTIIKKEIFKLKHQQRKLIAELGEKTFTLVSKNKDANVASNHKIKELVKKIKKVQSDIKEQEKELQKLKKEYSEKKKKSQSEGAQKTSAKKTSATSGKSTPKTKKSTSKSSKSTSRKNTKSKTAKEK